ncbi:amino acid-binding protein [Halorubrum saccharovorum]|uniref:Amino acid-binding protein n=1 Tax=Halorubrum saccharovorum TaxID=2248 RepID=A0A0F8BH19_9EURY|nr:amino acid-binding protein [Halorubrum saccharovorum]KKF39478.1 amino acid-binding protein [Halorubrum saccharovorum]
MKDDENTVNAYMIRLELVDEPGELLRSLRPISENGANLLSIFHERGSVTPRGHIPVEVDLEATESQYEAIVADLQNGGINVIQAGEERYSESLVCVLSGHIVDTDLSDTLSQIQDGSNATVTDLSLSAPQGTRNTSSARLRLAVEEGGVSETLETIRGIADAKDLHLIEPLTRGEL